MSKKYGHGTWQRSQHHENWWGKGERRDLSVIKQVIPDTVLRGGDGRVEPKRKGFGGGGAGRGIATALCPKRTINWMRLRGQSLRGGPNVAAKRKKKKKNNTTNAREGGSAIAGKRGAERRRVFAKSTGRSSR